MTEEENNAVVEEADSTFEGEETEESVGLIKSDSYDPLEFLSPVEQKFATLQVTTTMSNVEIGRAIGLSNHERYRLNKDPHVQAYIKQLQRKYTETSVMEAAKAQTRLIRERMFGEMFERLQDPEEAMVEWMLDREAKNLPPPSAREIADFRSRFMSSSSFSDFFKMWEKVEKSTRLDEGEATEIKDEKSIVTQVRRKYSTFREKIQKSRSHADIAKEAIAKGMGIEEYQALLDSQSKEEDGSAEEVIEAEFIEEEDGGEYEEVILEEWEIRRG